MKIFTKSKLHGLCGMLAIASAAFCAPADTAAQMYVGYVNPQEVVYPYTGFTNSSNEDLTLVFAIRVEASKFENIDGASLTGLRVGWSMGMEEMFPDIEVFVREELEGENLASGKDQMAYGWNDIKFDTPYTITSGKDLYIGGTVDWKPGAWLGTGVFGYNLPEKSQFMGNLQDLDENGKIKWIDATDNNMVIMALGIVEASGSEYNDIASLTDVRLNDVQPLAYPGDAYLVVKNDGLNSLQSFEISASLGDKTWSFPVQLSEPIASGEQREVTGGIQALGTGVHKMWLSKVNDKEVEKPSIVERELIGVPEEIAGQYTRRPLVERWVSESEYRTPVYTDDIFTPGISPFRDCLSLIAHHVSDQFMIYHEFDEEVDCEDLQFLVDFADGDKYRVFVPAFATDRSYLPRNPLSRSNTYSVAYSFIYPDFASPVYEAALDVPTFASVNAAVNVDGDKCYIEVSGKVEPGIMPEGEPLYLTVYVVEDGIESTSQEFPGDPEVEDRYKGVFTHNDVIRLSLTEMYGDKIDGDGEYSKKFSCELDPEWNREKMRVLAFVNRSGERYGHRQVINSVETGIKGSGVESIAENARNQFAVIGGDIVAAPGCRIEAYTLDGKRVASHGLRPGIYIVKAYGADGVSACKVTVK